MSENEKGLGVFRAFVEEIVDDHIEVLEHPITGERYSVYIKWHPEPGVPAELRVRSDVCSEAGETLEDTGVLSETMLKAESSIAADLRSSWIAGKWAHDNNLSVYLVVDEQEPGVLIYRCYPRRI